jgi:multiple sugar transport system substrate-binding protein
LVYSDPIRISSFGFVSGVELRISDFDFSPILFQPVKIAFLITFVFLLALSALAWALLPGPTENGKTILVWVSDDNPLRQGQKDPFNRLFPDLDLRLDPGNALPEKIVVQSLAGVGPDLFDCYGPNQTVPYVRSGIAWDVTDELAKMGIDVKNETWSATHPCCMLDGRVYGFPVNAAANATWYHKDLLQAQHIALPKGPWTWAQMIPIAQKLTLRDAQNHVTQWGLFIDWDPMYKQFILQWGGEMYSPDGTRCTIDSPACIAAIQFMADLIYQYKVCPMPGDEDALSAAGGWGSAHGSSITFFGAKKGALALGGRWWLCRLRDPDYSDLQLGAVESPYSKVRVFLGYGKATMINKNSPHREAALNFFKYLYSEEYNKLINHQADGICPVKKYVETDAYLHDPAYPSEDYNDVWRNMMKASAPEPTSPFINGAVANRHILKQLDLIRANSKSVHDALRDAAQIINETIADNIKLSPDLRARYEAVKK